MTTSAESLDQIAQDYHTNSAIPDIHIENLCQEYFVQWLLTQIPTGANVLELGYGDGIVTAALASAAIHLTMIEGAKTLVDVARQRHPSVVCTHSMFEEYVPEQRFNTILASHVLEHVDDPQAILRLLSQWLLPNGQAIIVVPNRDSLHRQLAVEMGLQPALDTLSKRDHMVGHQRVYSLPNLKADIREAGMSIVRSRGFFLKVLPNSMMLEYSTELLRALNAISSNLPEELMANIAVIAERANSGVSTGIREIGTTGDSLDTN